MRTPFERGEAAQILHSRTPKGRRPKAEVNPPLTVSRLLLLVGMRTRVRAGVPRSGTETGRRGDQSPPHRHSPASRGGLFGREARLSGGWLAGFLRFDAFAEPDLHDGLAVTLISEARSSNSEIHPCGQIDIHPVGIQPRTVSIIPVKELADARPRPSDLTLSPQKFSQYSLLT